MDFLNKEMKKDSLRFIPDCPIQNIIQFDSRLILQSVCGLELATPSDNPKEKLKHLILEEAAATWDDAMMMILDTSATSLENQRNPSLVISFI